MDALELDFKALPVGDFRIDSTEFAAGLRNEVGDDGASSIGARRIDRERLEGDSGTSQPQTGNPTF